MVSYKAGRSTTANAPAKPIDISDTGIDRSIADFGEYDGVLTNPAVDGDS